MLRLIGLLLRALTVPLPWNVRRRILNRAFGFEIDPSARIGFSWTFPQKLIMGPGARIGHLNAIHSLEEFRMDRYALVGQMNWFTDNLAGFDGPGAESRLGRRQARLHLHAFAAITGRHYIDCSDLVDIGVRSVIGGHRSQFQTHSIDLDALVQDCRPITIGPNSFVGAGCLLLGGSALPDNALLAAGSVLVGKKTETFVLYAGNPAEKKRDYDPDTGFFNRSEEWLLKNRSAYRR